MSLGQPLHYLQDLLSQMSFQRCARTDKGVSAARQVVSLKISFNIVLINMGIHLPLQLHLALSPSTFTWSSRLCMLELNRITRDIRTSFQQNCLPLYILSKIAKYITVGNIILIVAQRYSKRFQFDHSWFQHMVPYKELLPEINKHLEPQIRVFGKILI